MEKDIQARGDEASIRKGHLCGPQFCGGETQAQGRGGGIAESGGEEAGGKRNVQGKGFRGLG